MWRSNIFLSFKHIILPTFLEGVTSLLRRCLYFHITWAWAHATSITVKVIKPTVTFTSMPRVYSRFHHEFHTNSKIMKLLTRKYTDCSKRLHFHTHTRPNDRKNWVLWMESCKEISTATKNKQTNRVQLSLHKSTIIICIDRKIKTEMLLSNWWEWFPCNFSLRQCFTTIKALYISREGKVKNVFTSPEFRNPSV